MTFKQWLHTHIDDMTAIGDVAREVSSDTNFPKSNDYKVIFEYLDQRMPDKGIEAFEEAWKLYSSSK